jgi:hypothetical protein
VIVGGAAPNIMVPLEAVIVSCALVTCFNTVTVPAV